MNWIDITMTAVLRPSLLNKTLKTIVNNICKDSEVKFRLILNVDPVGEKIDPMQVVDTAKKYFDEVIYNIPTEPSFPKAVKWIWNASEAPYVFHWEDDVFILRKIDVKDMIGIHKRHEGISSLRLFKHDTPRNKTIKVFNSKWHYNKGGFYVADRWQEQFGLNPILIKRAFVKEAITLMRDDLNPEKQFRVGNDLMVPLISKWRYGLYTSPGDKALVWGKEGAAWKRSMGLKKGRKAFTTWVKGR